MPKQFCFDVRAWEYPTVVVVVVVVAVVVVEDDVSISVLSGRDTSRDGDSADVICSHHFFQIGVLTIAG